MLPISMTARSLYAVVSELVQPVAAPPVSQNNWVHSVPEIPPMSVPWSSTAFSCGSKTTRSIPPLSQPYTAYIIHCIHCTMQEHFNNDSHVMHSFPGPTFFRVQAPPNLALR